MYTTEDFEKAIHFLREQGYETGSNFTLSTVAVLMAKWEVRNIKPEHIVEHSKQCDHNFQRVERGGEFQGNQCECGEWEDLT